MEFCIPQADFFGSAFFTAAWDKGGVKLEKTWKITTEFEGEDSQKNYDSYMFHLGCSIT